MSAPDRHGSARRLALSMQQPIPRSTRFDRLFFLFGTASAVWLAVILALQSVRSWWSVLLFVPIWAIIAYLALPRLHRMLSDLYVPDYFFGRTRTPDGLLGDPVNLAVDGSAEQLDSAMTRAGWYRAEEITAASTWKIIVSTLTRRSYPTAPVSSLMLFGRRHDVAYQQEVEGNPKQRHHVRFWHCPPGWLLPGGQRVEWLGAGTYDTNVGVSFFTLQVTHRIDENTDVERDHVVSSIQEANAEAEMRILRDFTTGYHSRNGGGDRFITDGHLPIVDLGGLPVEPEEATPIEVRTAGDVVRRMPLTVAAAGIIVILGALSDFLSPFIAPEVWASLTSADEVEQVLSIGVLAVTLLISAAQIAVAVLVLRGGRRARAVLLVLLAIDAVTNAISYATGDFALGINGTLFGASLNCLALLALSSESAGAWARRKRLAVAPA